MKKIISALLLISVSYFSVYANDISETVKVCGACHGAQGISADPTIPNLAGQKAIYMAMEVKAIRDGVRTNSLMDAVVKGLTDQQIDRLAEHFSKLQPSKIGAKEVNELGQHTRAACISCHGTKGITVNEQWPNLAGQKNKYLEKQLLGFKNDTRNGSYMQVIAKELTDEQIAAVAEYFSQQPAGE